MPITIEDLSKKYPAASEYLTQIYLILRDYSYCNNRRLADHIGVSPSAVSQAVLRLKKLGLAEQDKYGMITLSGEGRVLAEELLKRHYLLEYLMVKKLQFPWELADLEAGSLQDKVSDDFITHLFSFLGNPSTCPHGNPFPDHPEAERILSAPPLLQCREGDSVTVVRISEEGERVEQLLHTCHELSLVPGKRFIVEEIAEQSIILQPEKTKSRITLDKNFAEYICVFPD